MKYAAYHYAEWLFDVYANSESEALAKAKAEDPQVTEVVLVAGVA